MAEVTRQVKPFAEALQALHEWQLAFWSNGSGRVPGFFQRRMQEDDRRNKEIDLRHGEILQEVNKLTDHKQAVDAFIVELRLAREFRERRESEAKTRRNFWILKVGVPVVVGVLGLLGVLARQAAPVVKILWDDYLHAHPVVTEQLRNRAAGGVTPAYAANQHELSDSR